MVKSQLAYLKKPRLASVEHFKKQKLEHQTHDTEQLRIDYNQVRTSDTQDTHDTDVTNDMDDTKMVEEDEETSFWHESANESESDTEDGGYSNIESGESKTEEEAAPPKPPKKSTGTSKEKTTFEGFMRRGC